METTRQMQLRHIQARVDNLRGAVITGDLEIVQRDLERLQRVLDAPMYGQMEREEWRMLGMAVVEAGERGLQEGRSVFHGQLVGSLSEGGDDPR